jgi:hypothetical protein
MTLSERITERIAPDSTEKKISGKTLRRQKIRHNRLLKEKGLRLLQGGLSDAQSGRSVLIYESSPQIDNFSLNGPHLTVVREFTETPVAASEQPIRSWR